jgi:hypothetical protein
MCDKQSILEAMTRNIHAASGNTLHQLKKQLGKTYDEGTTKEKFAFISVCPGVDKMTVSERNIMLFVASTTAMQDIGERGNGNSTLPFVLRRTYYDANTSDSEKKRIGDMLAMELLDNGTLLRKLSKYVKRGINDYNCRFNVYPLANDLLAWNESGKSASDGLTVREKWAFTIMRNKTKQEEANA